MSQGNIRAALDYSEGLVQKIREKLQGLALPAGSMVVAVGSLARREASEQSDIDYFVVADHDCEQDLLPKVRDAISDLGLRAPSPTGAFARVVGAEEMLEKIGGNNESNDDLTRRMLFLLESEWLYGEDGYHALFKGVIERYIRDGITQHQLARFFLNDLIRYYRTICVDFEYKTVSVGKSWGDRNIKLMFSRKLLYFSGVLAAAQTAQSSCASKRATLTRLLRMTPLARIAEVCGSDADMVVRNYDMFLGWMADGKVRDLLRSTSPDRKNAEEHTDEFRELKNSAHHFSWCLETLLHRRYAPTHPINQALLF